MNERDIFDALREIDPADRIDPTDAAQIKARVHARVLAQVSARRPGGRRVIVAVAVAVLALASIAAAVYLTRQPTQVAGIGCAEDLTLDVVHVIPPTGTLDPQQCAALWADGIIVNPAVAPAGQVPPLLGCVNDAGTLVVFPTDDQGLCERLGMVNYMPPSDATSSIVEVENRLVERINPQTCPSFDDTEQLIEQTLDAAGLDDWTVTVSQPPTDQRPCPSLSFRSDLHQIVIVPAPHTDQ